MRLPCNLTSATLPIRCSALSMTRSIRGAEAFWQVGIPQPRPGAVCETHGGIPIDGPSAGAAMFLALYSAYTETPVPNTLALTGEIGLHGQILPVGGVEDKLEAAQQAGATLALIPQENWREVYREMEIEVVPVGDAETLLRRVFPPGEGATLSEGMEFLVGQEIG